MHPELYQRNVSDGIRSPWNLFFCLVSKCFRGWPRLFSMKCDMDIRKDAYANVVLSSDTDMFFFQRFCEHMTLISLHPRCVQGSRSPERKYSVLILEPNASVARFVGAQTMYSYFRCFFVPAFFRVVLAPSFLPEDSLLIVVTCELSRTDILHSAAPQKRRPCGRSSNNTLPRETLKREDLGLMNAKIWQMVQSSSTKAENLEHDCNDISAKTLELSAPSLSLCGLWNPMLGLFCDVHVSVFVELYLSCHLL